MPFSSPPASFTSPPRVQNCELGFLNDLLFLDFLPSQVRSLMPEMSPGAPALSETKLDFQASIQAFPSLPSFHGSPLPRSWVGCHSSLRPGAVHPSAMVRVILKRNGRSACLSPSQRASLGRERSFFLSLSPAPGLEQTSIKREQTVWGGPSRPGPEGWKEDSRLITE